MSVKKQELWNIIETLPNETSNKVIDNVEDLKFSYVIDQAPRKLVIRSKKDLREKLEEGRYYIVDLLGLEVYTDEQVLLGTLEDIFNTGSNDIYVVKDDLGKQTLLPGIKDVIKNVDLEKGQIIVHLIPGLI